MVIRACDHFSIRDGCNFSELNHYTSVGGMLISYGIFLGTHFLLGAFCPPLLWNFFWKMTKGCLHLIKNGEGVRGFSYL